MNVFLWLNIVNTLPLKRIKPINKKAMEQGVLQEIEQLYQKFQKLGINEAVDYDSTTCILLLPIPQPLKAQRLRNLIRSFFLTRE